MSIKSADVREFFDQVPVPDSENIDNQTDSSGSDNDNNDFNQDDPDNPPPTPSVRVISTTTTPHDRPSLPVFYKQLSSAPKVTRFTTQQLHTLLGSRSLRERHC